MGRSRQHSYREVKKIEININKKNLIIRSIIAFAALFLAVILLTNSCSKYLNRSEYLSIDYPEIADLNGDKHTLFNEEISINYYYNLEKEQDTKSNINKKIKEVLNDNLVHTYQLLDANNKYAENGNEMHNLCYINEHPNEWISVNGELYNLLLTANTLSNDTEGVYSPFSGVLYQNWNELFLTESVSKYTPSNDPAFSEIMSDTIDRIVKAINDPTTNFEFNENNNQVKFNVSESNKRYVKLNLGLLSHAYMIDKLEPLLIEKGLNSGMITSTTGIAVSLGSDLQDGYSQINSTSYQTIYNGNKVVFDYSFFFNGRVRCMMFNAFNNFSFNSLSEKNYYYFENSEGVQMRSLILNSKTGYSDNRIHSTFTFSIENSLVTQLKENYNLYFSNVDSSYFHYTQH